ncbi:hypothetical protein BDF22DRAFT_671930, partial [Syncephalis plumigaleata]
MSQKQQTFSSQDRSTRAAPSSLSSESLSSLGGEDDWVELTATAPATPTITTHRGVVPGITDEERQRVKSQYKRNDQTKSPPTIAQRRQLSMPTRAGQSVYTGTVGGIPAPLSLSLHQRGSKKKTDSSLKTFDDNNNKDNSSNREMTQAIEKSADTVISTSSINTKIISVDTLESEDYDDHSTKSVTTRTRRTNNAASSGHTSPDSSDYEMLSSPELESATMPIMLSPLPPPSQQASQHTSQQQHAWELLLRRRSISMSATETDNGYPSETLAGNPSIATGHQHRPRVQSYSRPRSNHNNVARVLGRPEELRALRQELALAPVAPGIASTTSSTANASPSTIHSIVTSPLLTSMEQETSFHTNTLASTPLLDHSSQAASSTLSLSPVASTDTSATSYQQHHSELVTLPHSNHGDITATATTASNAILSTDNQHGGLMISRNQKTRSLSIKSLVNASINMLGDLSLKSAIVFSEAVSWHPANYLSSCSDAMAAYRFEQRHYLTENPSDVLHLPNDDFDEDISNERASSPSSSSSSNKWTEPRRSTSRSKSLFHSFAVRRRPTAPGYIKDPMRVNFKPTLSSDSTDEVATTTATAIPSSIHDNSYTNSTTNNNSDSNVAFVTNNDAVWSAQQQEAEMTSWDYNRQDTRMNGINPTIYHDITSTSPTISNDNSHSSSHSNTRVLRRTASGSYREVLLDGLDDPVAFVERPTRNTTADPNFRLLLTLWRALYRHARFLSYRDDILSFSHQQQQQQQHHHSTLNHCYPLGDDPSYMAFSSNLDVGSGMTSDYGTTRTNRHEHRIFDRLWPAEF